MGTQWGPNGDPNPQKGPHGDPGPQMGTHLGTVMLHSLAVLLQVPRPAGGMTRNTWIRLKYKIENRCAIIDH